MLLMTCLLRCPGDETLRLVMDLDTDEVHDLSAPKECPLVKLGRFQWHDGEDGDSHAIDPNAVYRELSKDLPLSCPECGHAYVTGNYCSLCFMKHGLGVPLRRGLAPCPGTHWLLASANPRARPIQVKTVEALKFIEAGAGDWELWGDDFLFRANGNLIAFRDSNGQLDDFRVLNGSNGDVILRTTKPRAALAAANGTP